MTKIRLFSIACLALIAVVQSYAQTTTKITCLFSETSLSDTPRYTLRQMIPESPNELYRTGDLPNSKAESWIDIDTESLFKLVINNTLAWSLLVEPGKDISLVFEQMPNQVRLQKIINSANTIFAVQWDSLYTRQVRDLRTGRNEVMQKKISQADYAVWVKSGFDKLINELTQTNSPLVAYAGFITIIYLEPDESKTLSATQYEFALARLEQKFPRNNRLNSARKSLKEAFNKTSPIQPVIIQDY